MYPSVNTDKTLCLFVLLLLLFSARKTILPTISKIHCYNNVAYDVSSLGYLRIVTKEVRGFCRVKHFHPPSMLSETLVLYNVEGRVGE